MKRYIFFIAAACFCACNGEPEDQEIPQEVRSTADSMVQQFNKNLKNAADTGIIIVNDTMSHHEKEKNRADSNLKF